MNIIYSIVNYMEGNIKICVLSKSGDINGHLHIDNKKV